MSDVSLGALSFISYQGCLPRLRPFNLLYSHILFMTGSTHPDVHVCLSALFATFPNSLRFLDWTSVGSCLSLLGSALSLVHRSKFVVVQSSGLDNFLGIKYQLNIYEYIYTIIKEMRKWKKSLLIFVFFFNN